MTYNITIGLGGNIILSSPNTSTSSKITQGNTTVLSANGGGYGGGSYYTGVINRYLPSAGGSQGGQCVNSGYILPTYPQPTYTNFNFYINSGGNPQSTGEGGGGGGAGSNATDSIGGSGVTWPINNKKYGAGGNGGRYYNNTSINTNSNGAGSGGPGHNFTASNDVFSTSGGNAATANSGNGGGGAGGATVTSIYDFVPTGASGGYGSNGIVLIAQVMP